MAAGGTFKSMGAFQTKFQRDMRGLDVQIEKARRRAAQKTAAYVRAHVPVAFSDLRDSVHEQDTKVVADAPHAASVELGSRPHWMPLEPLIKWVKLRGFQSLVASKSRARLPGTTTLAHAGRVGQQLESSRDGANSTATDAVIQIAKGIQRAIALKGTRPHFFMRNSIPAARGFLTVEINAVMSKV